MSMRPRTRLLLSAVGLLLVLVSGPAATAQEDAVPEPSRDELGRSIEGLRDRLGALAEDDPTAESLRDELRLLERLDGLALREQSLLDNQSRLSQAEAAMQEKLAAGPRRDVADNPPYPIALLDLLGDALDGLERQSQVLENAADAADGALGSARKEREEAESARRRRLEEVDRARTNTDEARARVALRIAELRLRIAERREAITELELDAARRDATLHEQNLEITRNVLVYVEQELDLSPQLRDEMLRSAEQRSAEIQRQRERAVLDLERTQARRLAAEKRGDELETLTPGLEAENEALASRQETEQVRIAKLGQQAERLVRLAQLRERRFRALAGEASRPEMREWASELSSLAAELERRRQVEEGRAAQIRSRRDRLEREAEGLEPGTAVGRWRAEELRALDDRLEIHSGEIANLDATRAQARRFQGELERRTNRMSVDDRLEIAARSARQVWETELVSFDDRPITVREVVAAILVLIAGFFLSGYLSRGIGRFTRRRTVLDAGASAAIESISYYLLVVAFLLIALRSANIPLTVFTILGGAFAIGLGFGSQNIIANFISGIILLLERPIKVDDMIEVDGTLGVVEGIGLRATHVRTFDNVHIVLPNSSFLEKNVVNWNLRDDTVRGKVAVGVAYGSPTREVERLLLQAAEEQKLILQDPGPSVFFLEFGDNALSFQLYFWIRAQNVLDRVRVESDLRYRIDELFRESEVVIAFPQQDVHLDTTRPLQVEWRASEDPKKSSEPPGS